MDSRKLIETNNTCSFHGVFDFLLTRIASTYDPWLMPVFYNIFMVITTNSKTLTQIRHNICEFWLIIESFHSVALLSYIWGLVFLLYGKKNTSNIIDSVLCNICELFVCPRAHKNIIGEIVGRQVFGGAATVHRLLRARDPQPLVPPQAGSQGSTQGGVILFIGQNCVFKLFL